MSFLENMKTEQNLTLSENGALALNSTGDNLVNLFAVAGAMRRRSEKDIKNMFAKAVIDDRLLAARMAFYVRDIRGGLGERRTGRIMLKYLAVNCPEIMRKNLAYIPEYGRYDDLVYLAKNMPEVYGMIQVQLLEDLENMELRKPVSLLAKWLPSVNASSKGTVLKGRKTASVLGMSEKEYRKTLAKLRDYLNVTEVNLSAKTYEDIVYSEVPSKAMNNYRNAFRRNDEERFNGFLEKLNKGETKINVSTLFPYDITFKYLYENKKEDTVLEKQWEALPDYVEGENKFLVMADVSGSMYGKPLATSVGLALYFAERNRGAFAGKFMTFSARPELVEIKGNSLFEKLKYIENADWEMNTNLEAAFRLVLNTAVKNKTPKEDLPSSIVVITDMEIDQCTRPDWLFYDRMKADFEYFGYEIPNIVFWNVDARKNTYHASFDRKGVQLASGSSPSVFASLVKGENMTPYEYMLSVLNAERYERIEV